MCCALRRGPSGPTEGNVKHRVSVFISPGRHVAWLRPACNSTLGVLRRNHSLSMTIFISLLPWGALHCREWQGFFSRAQLSWATSFAHRVFWSGSRLGCKSPLGENLGRPKTFKVNNDGKGKRMCTLSLLCPPPFGLWVVLFVFSEHVEMRTGSVPSLSCLSPPSLSSYM